MWRYKGTALFIYIPCVDEKLEILMKPAVLRNGIISGLMLRVHNKNKIFLFLNQNICCGYSKEPFQ